MDEYLFTPVGRRRTPRGRLTRKDWQPNHYESVKRDLTRAVAKVRDLPDTAVVASAADALGRLIALAANLTMQPAARTGKISAL